MDNKKIITFVGVFLLIGAFLVLLTSAQPQTGGEKEGDVGGQETEGITNAEKIEVIHFHATQQCWACVTLGELALKTIEQEFPKEYEEGLITFQDANVDLAENRELASKYQARGSSLYINAIVDGEDNIEEDIAVWRLLGSESAFIEYFSDKLSSMLEE